MWSLVALVLSIAIGAISSAQADEIAFSFVYGENRIDVPESAVLSIQARSGIPVRIIETDESSELPSPHVEICLSGAIKAQLCTLTERIVGEPMEIWVNCRVVSSAVVREPLCSELCLRVSAFDMDEAERKLAELTAKPRLTCF